MGKISRALEKAQAQRTVDFKRPAVETETVAPRTVPGKYRTTRATGEIKRVPDAYGVTDEHVICVSEPSSHVASQFRTLRTNLIAKRIDQPHVIAITSGTRGEGKTTVAVNLAAVFAEMEDTKVVIVDTDFYRPMIHEVFGVTPRKVLNEVLTNGLDLDEALYATAIPNLDILPAMPSSRSGMEGVLEKMAGPLLNEIVKHYDYVIVDTPPVISASHAALIGRWTDGLLLVARSESTPRQVVRRAVDELERGGAKVIGCVLTHVTYHIPDFIYRLLGTPSKMYYDYYKPLHAKEKG